MTLVLADDVDHELTSIATSGLADDEVPVATGGRLFRVGKALFGLRADGTVFASRVYASRAECERAWRFVVGADTDTEEDEHGPR